MPVSHILRRLARILSRHERRGIASIEFAIYSIVFLSILAGTVDVGNLIFSEFQIDSSIAAGAQYAVINASLVESTDAATLAGSISAIVNNGHTSSGGWTNTVVVNNGPTVVTTSGTPSSSGSAANADNYYCPTGTPGSWTWGAAKTSGASCGGSVFSGKFVTISSSRTVAPFFPAWAFVTSGTISRYAMVQVQ